MAKRKSVQFNCFSPPVMIATVVIETTLALYTVWRYKMSAPTRLVTTVLLALATFQVAEYFVCTGYGSVSAEAWSRVGFVAITTLPALGLHLMHVLAGKSSRRLVYTAYASMAVFTGIFLLYQGAFTGHQCTGNYVIFQTANKLGGANGLYYYGWLFVGIMLGARWANELRAKTGKAAKRRLDAVRALIIGYLIFLVPTALANTVKPETRQAIPSIMCGFAVLFALIMGFYILPRMGAARKSLTNPFQKVFLK